MLRLPWETSLLIIKHSGSRVRMWVRPHPGVVCNCIGSSTLRGRSRKNEALLWRHTTLLLSAYNSTYAQGTRLVSTQHVYESYSSILTIGGLKGWNMIKSITLRTPHFFWTCPQVFSFLPVFPFEILDSPTFEQYVRSFKARKWKSTVVHVEASLPKRW